MVVRLLKFSELGSVLVLGLLSLSVGWAEAQPQGVPDEELEPVAVIDPVFLPVEALLPGFELVLAPTVAPMKALEPLGGAWRIRKLSGVSGAGLDQVGPEALPVVAALTVPGDVDELNTCSRISATALAVAPQRPVKAETAHWSLVPFRVWVDSPAARLRQQADHAREKGDEALADEMRRKYWQTIERTATRRALYRQAPDVVKPSRRVP